MTGTVRRVDAVVVGAGTAGANAAYQLARRGLATVLLERRAARAGGAQWHNGVLDWQFVQAGLDPPAPPERATAGGVAHLFGPDGTRAVTVHDSPIVRADMGRLGTRLRDLAADAGVEIVDEVGALAVDVVGGRLAAVEARSLRFEAPLFVDASGRRGTLRRRSPVLRRWCPEVRGDELCTAADHHLRIDDPDGAKRFLERHDAEPGDSVTVVGLAGGFSTRAITVSADLDEASILVGCLANGRYGTGPSMLTQARADEPWLGSSISGGAGVIPLRRPYARITAPGLALVGDAASQVFPGHGSGIGMGLMAGSRLADTVADAADLGDEQVLWRYQAAFQHEHGGLLAAFDAFRRMSTALGGPGVARMVRAGLLTEDMTRGGLDQRWQTPPPAGIPAMVARLASVPGVAARMLPMLARGQLLRAEGARHPDEADEQALARWDARVERLLGPLPH
jgi:flavin-dependent dehydrogenase